jgi:PAS domain S-box-containing protein
VAADLLPSSYNPALVILSMGVATLASFVSLDVAARIWPARGWRRLCWIAAAATAMGGGIWSMHFIAMLAFSLPVAIQYDVPVTVFSLLTAILVTGLAFAVVAGGRSRGRLLAAGTVMGGGVAAMHYGGMSAMRLQAELFYTPGLFIASIVVACVAATAALWIALQGGGPKWRLLAAIIMGAAVSGMHYTAMTAACFSPAAAPLSLGTGHFERASLAVAIAVGTLLILSLELLSAAIDRRFSAFRLREAEILHLSARRFEKLVQSSNDLIVVVDPVGTVEFAASSSRTALGLDPADLERRNIFDFVTGPGTSVLTAVLTAREARAAFAFVDRLEIRDEAGAVRRYEATVCNLLDEAAVKGIALTFHDVTERERSAEELRRASQISDEANRMKSEFVANMSHELRTPLNAIIGFSAIIAGDGDGKLSAAKYREYSGDVNRSAEHLLAIINDILDLSKAEADQLTLRESLVDARASSSPRRCAAWRPWLRRGASPSTAPLRADCRRCKATKGDCARSC